ncbi:MAG: ABC transporter ATP-binding protein [Desulfovibrionaceae bacterium]
MSLRATVRKRLGHFCLHLDMACAQGETVCVVGPSGSGKTTLLRLLAGLDRPDSGSVRMGDAVWLDSGAGVCLPPQRREAGLVFQDYNLFPHMTLRQNVAYAARDGHVVDALLAVFGIAHLADAPPARLSGGERQRGALCQALARGPKLLLLDEPFSALDLETRLGLRLVLRQVQRDTPLCMVHVTHDLNEALFLGDRVVAVRQGREDAPWLARQLGLLREEQAAVAARQDRYAPTLSHPQPERSL